MIGRRLTPYLIGIVAAVTVAGCAAQLVPVAGQGGEVDLRSNIVTKEAEGIRISVQTQEWRFWPQNLEDFFTPLLVLIKNQRKDDVAIRYSDFILLDGAGNQLSAVPSNTVEQFMIARYVPFSYPYPPGMFYPGYFPPLVYGLEHPYYPSRVTDVTLLSLPETDLRAGAQTRGFLYFRNVGRKGGMTIKARVGGAALDFEFQLR